MVSKSTSKSYRFVVKKPGSKGGINMAANTQIKNSPICPLINNEDFIGKLVDIIQRDSSPARRGVVQKVEDNFIEILEGSGSRTFICCSRIGAIVRLN